MHELYIAQCILKLAAASLPPDVPAAAVSRIAVAVGQLEAVVPANLVFLFDAAKKNYQMPNARLKLNSVPAVCRCCNCKKDFTPLEPIFLCPECGSGSVEVLRGRGIILNKIVITDESDGS